jgi:hypothetical protein
MPWELDYALLSFSQLKKSYYYLNKDDQIYIDVVLNLSSYIINWEETKIPKEFFIDKFKNLQSLLKDYTCKFTIFDQNTLYGGLDSQRASTEDYIDFYVILNPDIYFSETLLFHLIESSKLIKNKSFTVTPQIPKLWDYTWDIISHSYYKDLPYEEWDSLDVYDVRRFSKNLEEDIYLTPNDTHKWAGWMDLHDKNTWDWFWGSHQDWTGYGGCDFYAMQLSQYAKQQGVDFQQYILENQIICEYEIGPLKGNKLSSHYKNQIVMNEIPNQRKQFDEKMEGYLMNGVKMLKQKNII